MRFKLDGAFAFGDMFKEDVNEDVLIGLIPFVSKSKGECLESVWKSCT